MTHDNMNEPEDDEPEELLSQEEIANENARMHEEFHEDMEKYQEISDRADSWAAGMGLTMEQAGAEMKQIYAIIMLQNQRILLEILDQLKKANGQF